MRKIAALLLFSVSGAAVASGIVETSTEAKRYGSRKACEKALLGMHAAAAARLAAAPEDRRKRVRLEAPFRDDDDRLSYFEVTDNTLYLPDVTMPLSESDEYSCKGRTLKHRSYLEGGSFEFVPPLPPQPEPPPAQESQLR